MNDEVTRGESAESACDPLFRFEEHDADGCEKAEGIWRLSDFLSPAVSPELEIWRAILDVIFAILDVILVSNINDFPTIARVESNGKVEVAADDIALVFLFDCDLILGGDNICLVFRNGSGLFISKDINFKDSLQTHDS